MVYRRTAIYFFQGLCLRALCSVSPSSRWLDLHRVYSQTAPTAPSLRPLGPSVWLRRWEPVQVCHHRFPPVATAKSSWSSQCSYSVRSFYFRFAGCRPLNNVQQLTLHSLIEVRTISFATSSSAVFLKMLPNILSFLRRTSFISLSPLFYWCLPFRPTSLL
jgi:hypothetical protein